MHRLGLAVLAGALLLTLVYAGAQQRKEETREPEPSSAREAPPKHEDTPTLPLVAPVRPVRPVGQVGPDGLPKLYIPPARGTVAVRVGAATRGGAPGVEALAPGHLAFTTRAQPLLWWYVSVSAEARVDVTLIGDGSTEPLLHETVSERATPGIHSLDLAARGVRLEKGHLYQWFVSLSPVPGSGSSPAISGGAVQWVEAGAELRRALDGAAAGEAWAAYARFGVWYDALSGISRRIREDPQNPELRRLRARLLSDAELSRAAAWDRGAGAGAGGA